MKKKYEKPDAVVVEMSFDEHIAAGSGDVCSNPWSNSSASDNSKCVPNKNR